VVTNVHDATGFDAQAHPSAAPYVSAAADRTLDQMTARADERLHHLRERRPLLVVLSGPSGVGKDTVLQRLRERYPEAYFAVTATTRPPRENETHGVDYFFLEREDFERRLAEGGFLESAVVYGNRYGVPKEGVREALAHGQDAVVKVDVQGAATIRGLVGDAGVFIFLAPESMSELLRRLWSRKTDDFTKLMERFNTASRELERVGEFDYVVFNEAGRLDQTLDEICAIIAASHSRIRPPAIAL